MHRSVINIIIQTTHGFSALSYEFVRHVIYRFGRVLRISDYLTTMLFGVIFALIGCQEEKSDSGDILAEQHAYWDSHRPKQYIVQACTHGAYPPGCVRMAVDGTTIIRAQQRIYDDILDWEEMEPDPNYEPIEYMFDHAKKIPFKCRQENVEYDDEYGFVTDYRLGCDSTDSNTEGQYVACFKAEAPAADLESCDVTPDW